MPPDTGNLPLAGKRAIVTGAGRGIGRSIALALARAGAEVALTARTAADLQPVAAEIEAMGRRVIVASCDVTDPRQVEAMSKRVLEEWGGLEVLVNNAGHAGSHKFVGHPDELWHEMVRTNLTSVYYVTKAFAPALIEARWGRIINIASTAARVGARYVAAYTAAKH
ncbi:MAG TPA: SDR family oxidoreductase, partial [Chloroflexia bacterium]|nr:SDR family oxidoreductase [Chloroflexia bacterium]